MKLLLLEVTVKQIRRRVDPKSKERSKKLTSTFITASKEGTIKFDTESGTNPGIGLYWNQKVKLLDFKEAMSSRRGNDLNKVRDALKGDIKVMCDCPAFKWWGWQYIATQEGFKFGQPQNIYPKIRNPKLTGSVCKHLENVLLILPFLAPRIVKERRGG
jgi:hypothetical protein